MRAHDEAGLWPLIVVVAAALLIVLIQLGQPGPPATQYRDPARQWPTPIIQTVGGER